MMIRAQVMMIRDPVMTTPAMTIRAGGGLIWFFFLLHTTMNCFITIWARISCLS